MKSRAKGFVYLFLFSAFVPLGLLLAALWVYDPLQIFHAPWGRPATLHENMRLQAIGVIKTQPFDSVILGTSILENSSAVEASNKLGGSFVNLSISAGDFFERSLMLDYLFRNRKISRLIYSVDFIYLNQRKGYWFYPLQTFDYLYDKNPLNDFRVYLNTHYLGCLRHWSSSADCVGRQAELDRPNAWFSNPEYASRFGGLEKWCQARDNHQIRDVREKLAEAVGHISRGEIERPTHREIDDLTGLAINYIEDNLLVHVERHPETEFYLVLPPYSRAKFAIWYQEKTGYAAVHAAVVRHLAAKTGQLANLHLFGYEDQNFLDDIAQYKDMDHFQPALNSVFIESIKHGTNAIGPANVEAYLDEARRRGVAFRLDDLLKRLDNCDIAQPDQRPGA